MTLVFVAILAAIWVGAVIAISTHDPGTAAIGLAIALVASALLADPLPPPALLGALVVAGLLAAALVRTAAPSRLESAGPGWPAEAFLATAGGFAGLGLATALAAVTATMPGAAPSGPPSAASPLELILTPGGLAAAGAGQLLAVALAPAVSARPGPRHAAALVLLVQAVLLFRQSVAGQPVELEVIASAALIVAAAAVGALLARLAAEAAPRETAAPTDSGHRHR